MSYEVFVANDLRRYQKNVPEIRADIKHISNIKVSWDTTRGAGRRHLASLTDKILYKSTEKYSALDNIQPRVAIKGINQAALHLGISALALNGLLMRRNSRQLCPFIEKKESSEFYEIGMYRDTHVDKRRECVEAPLLLLNEDVGQRRPRNGANESIVKIVSTVETRESSKNVILWHATRRWSVETLVNLEWQASSLSSRSPK